MKRNLVGEILGKIKIFVQDFVPIRTALGPRLEAVVNTVKGLLASRRVFCWLPFVFFVPSRQTQTKAHPFEHANKKKTREGLLHRTSNL